MLDHIYYDGYTREYVLNRNQPYNRYILILRGSDLDVYKESWKTNSDAILSIGYTQELIDDCNVPLEVIRQYHAKQNHCSLISLLSKTIPAAKFDEYVERFGLGNNNG